MSPFKLHNLYPCLSNLYGYSDSFKHAAGGFWIIPQHDETKNFIVRTFELPPDVVLLFKQVTISINDL